MDQNISRPATFEDLKKLIKALNEQDADYILIGGYALYAHGLYRTTTDIDILTIPTKEAGEKIVNALLVLADKSAENIDPAWFEDKDTIRLADEIVVDIMFNAAGETYDTLKKYIEIIELDGIRLKTLNLAGLLLTKKTFRDKDKIDRAVLEQALKFLQKGK